MLKFERILVRFMVLLCKVFAVTPKEVEKERRKLEPAPRPKDRPDIFEA